MKSRESIVAGGTGGIQILAGFPRTDFSFRVDIEKAVCYNPIYLI